LIRTHHRTEREIQIDDSDRLLGQEEEEDSDECEDEDMDSEE